MKPDEVKAALKDSIHALADCRWFFSKEPLRNFTRSRKLPFEKVVSAILAFRGGSLSQELLDFFGLDADTASSSAFIQQRAKIIPETFETLFDHFSRIIPNDKLYKGFRLLAIDGSDIQIPANPGDPDSFFPGANGQKPYNLLHLNAVYDLIQRVYTDALLQKRKRSDEHDALVSMVDRSTIENAILLADRGYESFNNLAHIQEKGWRFLFRIKDSSNGIASGLDLPHSDEYDIPFCLKLTRKQTNEVKTLLKDKNRYKHIASSSRFDFLPLKSRKHLPTVFYDLSFRIVRFPVSDSSFETIITNLPPESFPLPEIQKLYAMRWGIETSFRHLKYTLGLLHFHAKKVEFVHQEIFAKLTMYNFCELITCSVVIHQGSKKLAYQVNFSAAVHVCLHFFLDKLPPPKLEALLAKLISPVRHGRKYPRKPSPKSAFSFTYRIA